jgi:hypothetical protein
MFIKKIENFIVDLDQIKKDLSNILAYTQWIPENQIGVTYRINTTEDLWKDSVGSLYDRDRKTEMVSEKEFTEINQNVPEYTRSVLDQLVEHTGCQIGRARYMLLESKKGLTVHYDTSIRYHLVIETNPYAYIAHTVNTSSVQAMCYHLPSDGYFYQVNTRQEHFVYNGGLSPRIHLVICPI